MQNILAQSSNTGFVSGNIWYSKDPFDEGDKIKIYTFVFNPDNRELSGTVIFFDKTVLLGKKDFTVSAKSANDISVDWTVTAGDHTIFGKIENAKFLISAGKYQEVYLAENETEKSSRTVSKKIVSKTTDTTGTSVSDIAKTIQEKTPDFIIKPITSSVDILETFREDLNTSSENKKEELKNEIKELDNPNLTVKLSKDNTTIKTDTNSFLKPFKYIQIFFLTIFSFIVSNKILFYGLILVILFFILRFIWKKIF